MSGGQIYGRMVVVVDSDGSSVQIIDVDQNFAFARNSLSVLEIFRIIFQP